MPDGTVGICLMKSDEADATITHLRDQSPDIRVEDHVTYFRVMTESGLRIDLREVAAYLGRDLPMSSFLVTLSAYFGQIDVDDPVLVISPVALDGGDGHRR
ncbi:MAG TPA: MmoB/DmpM family protein [Acidimicrobiia bacterium]|nr:MmoB/DmpM family protein [Acidimicrobiia bacterium]